MTEHEDNRVHYLIDACEVRGHLDITPDDLSLILIHQRELGIEEGKGCLEQIRWERDIAISQLEDIGASFGLKMSLWLAEHDKDVILKFAEWFAKCSKVSEPIFEHTVNRWIEDYEKEQKK